MNQRGQLLSWHGPAPLKSLGWALEQIQGSQILSLELRTDDRDARCQLRFLPPSASTPVSLAEMPLWPDARETQAQRLEAGGQTIPHEWRLVILLERSLPASLQSVLRCLLDSRYLPKRIRTLSSLGLLALEMRLVSVDFSPGDLREELRRRLPTAAGLSLREWSDGVPIRLVAIDMDSTLTQEEAIDEMARLLGVFEEVARITERAMRGEMDFAASLARRCHCLAGASEAIFDKVAERITDTPGAERLLKALHQKGCGTLLLSGGFQPIVERWARRFGFDHFAANRLEVQDGRLTGRLSPPIVDGEFKKEEVRRLAQRYGLEASQVAAIGDGANDLPMLEWAGLGIAFNAKPAVQSRARHLLNLNRLDPALYLMGYSDADLL